MRLRTLTSVALCLLTSQAMAASGDAPIEPASQASIGPQESLALPGDSIYHLDVDMVDQRGETIALSVYAGKPVLISMFYASCPMACPMLIADVTALEDKLTAEERAGLRVLLVSLDPEADTPEELRGVVERHVIDQSRWRLASPPEPRVRDIAALLGISYQAIEGGELHHSSIITLLDSQGRIIEKLDGLQQSPEPLLQALRALE